MNRKTTARLAAAALLLGACGGAEPPADMPADTASPAAQGMPGMQGMDMGGGAMMEEMTTHMESMGNVRGDSLRAVLPSHRQRVANAVAQMNREMRDMDMAADARWTALVDSIRTDLTTMPEMSVSELESLMPEHRSRVMRILAMHRQMMAGMRD